MSVHVHKSGSFVHRDMQAPHLTELFGREETSEGAGVALSQMLPHCTRFLQLALTHSVQGMRLFRVSFEKVVAGGGCGETAE